MACFAGGLLVNPICGEPVLAALGDSYKLAMATALWFALYYCPQDLVYNVSKMFPVRIIMYTIKGLYYPKKVLAGMKHAQHELPGNFLAMLLVAVCKGNGSGIIKPLCRLARGVWTPSGLETMLPSVTTKYCVLAALCLFFIPSDATYVAVAGLFLSMKVGPLFGVPVDFFSPIENKISPLLLGEEGNDLGTLLLTGYVRSNPLSVNGLLHLPGWGDFLISQIDAPTDPHPLPNRSKNYVAPDDGLTVFYSKPDSRLQESTQ